MPAEKGMPAVKGERLEKSDAEKVERLKSFNTDRSAFQLLILSVS